MREQLHGKPSARRRQLPAVHSRADLALLDQADPRLLERLNAATCEFYPDRERHVERVALVILKARP